MGRTKKAATPEPEHKQIALRGKEVIPDNDRIREARSMLPIIANLEKQAGEKREKVKKIMDTETLTMLASEKIVAEYNATPKGKRTFSNIKAANALDMGLDGIEAECPKCKRVFMFPTKIRAVLSAFKVAAAGFKKLVPLKIYEHCSTVVAGKPTLTVKER